MRVLFGTASPWRYNTIVQTDAPIRNSMKYKLFGVAIRWGSRAFLTAVFAFAAFTFPASAAGLDVAIVDGQISIQATAVPLGELLVMLDRVAGTESTLAPGLERRNVSVRFSNLDLDAAVKKIFEGSGLDYLVVGHRRIMVTAVAGVPAPVSNTPPPAAAAANPFQAPTAAQPAVVQTPFGPMVNPRAGSAAGAVQAQGGGALAIPEQAVSPFGAGVQPQAQSGQPTMFGNTSPPIMDLNKQQPQTQPTFPGANPTTQPTQGSPFPQTNPNNPTPFPQ
jgi:hypothetical protein